MTYTTDELHRAVLDAPALSLSRILDSIRWLDGMVDAACAAALAHGIPLAEMWLERQTDRIETRLMRHAGGPPAPGEYSRGEVVARVWLDGTEFRYEGIQLGAGWTVRGGEA